MSEVKVNKISPRTNCGTVTLGDSGDTFTIPAGATITNNGTAAGFGATGAASWDTTVKTSGFTAVSGVGYFVNTTSGAITVTLPASPDAGAVVAVSDYANNFATNNLTLGRNGSNIGGVAANSVLVVNGAAVTLVYVDATKGWIVTDSGNQSEASELKTYITATGGTITCSPCGDYKIHTFTGPGTFTVCSVGNPAGSDTVSYAVVAGGAGGGGANAPPGSPYGAGGGGGAGGYREAKASYDNYTAAPIAATTGLPVSAQGYPIVVGAAGSAGPAFDRGGNGNNSTFSTITSTAGGGGGSRNVPTGPGLSGGSGGGGGSSQPSPAPSPTNAGGSGNTPPVSPAQGFSGGIGANSPYCANGANAGGGGGAIALGANSVDAKGGDGGAGATSSINGTPTARAGGGGGGAYVCGSHGTSGSGAGGTGGGGPGGPAAGSTSSGNGSAATVNTGGGGGGASTTGPSAGPRSGGAGGSGIVIIRYKFQN